MSTTQRTSGGDLVLPRVILTDPARVAVQTLQDALSLWQGEWFLNTNDGFPWGQKVLGLKNPNVTQIKQLLRQLILSVPAIVDTACVVAFDSKTRNFSYGFAATLNTGQQIIGGSGMQTQITGGD